MISIIVLCYSVQKNTTVGARCNNIISVTQSSTNAMVPPPQPLLLQQTTISKLFLSKKFSLNKKFRGVNVETKISQFSNKHLRIRQAACSSELCAVLQHNIVRTQSFIGRSLDTRRTFSDAFVITAIYIRSTECLGTMLPYDRSILVLSQN